MIKQILAGMALTLLSAQALAAAPQLSSRKAEALVQEHYKGQDTPRTLKRFKVLRTTPTGRIEGIAISTGKGGKTAEPLMVSNVTGRVLAMKPALLTQRQADQLAERRLRKEVKGKGGQFSGTRRTQRILSKNGNYELRSKSDRNDLAYIDPVTRKVTVERGNRR
jgi:hypothetical protein